MNHVASYLFTCRGQAEMLPKVTKMQTLPKQLYIAYLNRPRLLITSNKKYFSFQLKLKLFFQTSNVSKIGSDVGVLKSSNAVIPVSLGDKIFFPP